MIEVGRIRIDPVIDGRILSALPASKPLPDPGTPLWQDQHGMFRADGLVESAVGAFLVRVDDRVVLVDAGCGQPFEDEYVPPLIDPSDPGDPLASEFRALGVGDDDLPRIAESFGRIHVEQGGLLRSLGAVGLGTEDVTDVVLTHLHFDHVGWVSAGGSPVFPHATVRCAAADLDFFLADPEQERITRHVYRHPPAADRLAPVLDRVETWEADTTLFPGLDVRLAPGHTPGSSVVVVADGADRAMMLGDVIHCPLELMDDDFDLLVDYDQAAADRVREAYARELEGSGVAIAGSHFPGLEFGRLLPGEGIRRWSFGG